jgi:hypothetical protein
MLRSESNILSWARIAKRTASVVAGLAQYLTTGTSSAAAHRALLDLHCRTNGRVTEWLKPIIRTLRPARRTAPASGILGHFSAERQGDIASAITRDGFYIFAEKVPMTICDEIEKFAASTPAIIHDDGDTPKPLTVYDPIVPVSKIYRIREMDSVGNAAIQRLIGDPVFLGIAELYLSTLPLLSGIGLWWSPAGDKLPKQDTAQSFHFDFDAPPAWLKLFVYLTDVGPDTGPHTFVRGSHVAGNSAMAAILRDGYVRLSDERVVGTFGAENVVSIEGLRGTVFFVDTRGLHKGKAPVAGHRLLTSFLYAPPHFNDWTDSKLPRKIALSANVDPVLSAAIVRSPRAYKRYSSEHQ